MYYTNSLPLIDSIVFVTIKDFSKHGTYCNLIEYDGIEGFILNTELDRRVFDPKKQFQLGKIYPMLALSVDKKTNKIDLSYKKINIPDRPILVNKFYDVSRIVKLCDEISFFTEIPKNEIYKNTLHKMFEDEDPLEIASGLYTKYLNNPSDLVEFLIESYPEQSTKFIENIKSRITYGNMTMSKLFKLRMFDTDSVKKLIDLLSYTDPLLKTEIIYNGSPKYLIKTIGSTKEICMKNIQTCIECLEKDKLKYNCQLETYLDADETTEFGFKVLHPREITLKPLKMI
jgi:translation initiation factor 2 alpha subunit (eIF-2alpha)